MICEESFTNALLKQHGDFKIPINNLRSQGYDNSEYEGEKNHELRES